MDMRRISGNPDLVHFAENPCAMLEMGRTYSLDLDPLDVEGMQAVAVGRRFAELRSRLPVLGMLARECGIARLETLDDAAKLLFRHSIYKSYPVALIEKGRFDQMTRWLGRLTTIDVSGVDVAGVDSVDGWMDALLRDAGVRIVHSTGTSGKLSFLPVGPQDSLRQTRAALTAMEPVGGPAPDGLAEIPMIVVGQRVMFNGYGAKLEAFVRDIYRGDESRLYVMDEGRLSADVLSLGGRLAAAENRGALGRAELSPALGARIDEFVTMQRSGPARRARFFDEIFDKLRGQRVMLSGNWSMLHDMMTAGRERGLADGVFAPDSLVQCAGGTKGREFADGFREDIRAFLGVARINEGYGMSEIPSLMGMCEARQYHIPPWLVAFVLDPRTGAPSPREGTHTGRFGVIDLTLRQRWGGVLSGDRVTMSFGRCACGRSGPHIVDDVSRFTQAEGGDDKITCAGAPEASDSAIAFLAGLAK